MKFLPHWIFILVSLWTAQVAAMAQGDTCQMVASGLRATNNAIAGPWIGYKPFGLDPSDAAALQSKYLQSRVLWDFSGAYSESGATVVSSAGSYRSDAIRRLIKDGALVQNT